MTILSASTRAKQLARYCKDKGLATLTHSQALEAIAHSEGLKAYNVLAAREGGESTAHTPLSHSSSTRAQALLRSAIAEGLTFSESVSVFAESQSTVEKLYATAARRAISSEGELEIDSNTIVSLSDDKGAYVMSWSWIDQREVELPPNAALPFLMNYDRIGYDFDETGYIQVNLDELELDDDALEHFVAGEILAEGRWLVRTKGATPTSGFTLTVAHLKALKPNAGREYYEGTMGDKSLFLEFLET
jgi:hypothetical protein